MADPSAVAALLLEMPQGVCVDCIVRKTGVEPGELRAAFHRLAGLVRVVARPGQCRACSKGTMVFALATACVGVRPRACWLQAVEEQVDGLALLRPRLEGGRQDGSGHGSGQR
jgi:hypothetical protein